LKEKPDQAQAQSLEKRHGAENLALLEGRARLTLEFIRFARTRKPSQAIEQKLSLTVRDYAQNEPVAVVVTTSDPDPRVAGVFWAAMTTGARLDLR
jgi:hypothetical protein